MSVKCIPIFKIGKKGEWSTTEVLRLQAALKRARNDDFRSIDHTHPLWRLAAVDLRDKQKRYYEALAIFHEIHRHRQEYARENGGATAIAGNVLFEISECYWEMGFRAHSKRYVMLSLIADVLQQEQFSDENGCVLRLVQRHGFPQDEIAQYKDQVGKVPQMKAIGDCDLDPSNFPEAVLQMLQKRWLREVATEAEANHYITSASYIAYLLAKINANDKQLSWKALEIAADYVLSCIPGCETMYDVHTESAQHDVVCFLDGCDSVLRTLYGRAFLCECKHSEAKPADVTDMMRLCYALSSMKRHFGIMISSKGISKPAEREQAKAFQNLGIVVVALDHGDLETIAKGGNLTTMLRDKYRGVIIDQQRRGGRRQ